MQTKTLQIDLPPYLTVGQYQKISEINSDKPVDNFIGTIAAIIDVPAKEVSYWTLDSIKKVYDVIKQVSEPKNEFHSLLEWNGELYGYANIKPATLGEYIDLESLAKDVQKNLHKIAAILYRPVVSHEFDTVTYEERQSLKMVNNQVEDVFDWYEIERYDSKKRKKREKSFKDFPVHVALGALSFFLTNASQYLNSIAYSQNKIDKKTMIDREMILTENLLANTGAGGGLFTHSVRPIYSKFQERKPSRILTS